MGKEHDKVGTHNLNLGIEVAVVYSFELQLNYGNLCRLVRVFGCELHEANFSTILWRSWAK